MIRRSLLIASIASLATAFATVSFAAHSWGSYHWARTGNPFTLKLGDNVSSFWDAYLGEASNDWSVSSVLDTLVVTGQGRKNCRPSSGRVEVCNARYGNNGWLGIAQIWVSGDHITQGVVKMNDTYFNTSPYSMPAWRRLVMCQEIGHTFGLDHQDEDFGNPNLGTCMDYASDPGGLPSNEHPNIHDYEQLEAIYAHLDGSTTVSPSPLPAAAAAVGLPDQAQWGKAVRTDAHGHPSLYERDLGGGHKVFTFVVWTE